MHIEIDLGDLFNFTHFQELFQHWHNIINDFHLFFLTSDQLVPLHVQDLIPVTDIVKIVDSESFELLFDGLFTFLVGVLWVGVDGLVDVVAVVVFALGGDCLQFFGKFGENSGKEGG